MNSILRATAVVALILVGVLAPSTALAGGPGGCGSQIAGLTAQADFTSAPDASGNVTEVFMFAQQGSPSGLLLGINVYNATTFNPVSEAASCVSLPSGSLTISPDLTSAQLSPTSVHLFDFVNNVYFDVTASASWAGSGALSHSIATSIENSSGFHVSAHLLDTSRGAASAGTVTGGGTSYVSTPSDFAQIDDVKYGSVAVGFGNPGPGGGFGPCSLASSGQTAQASFNSAPDASGNVTNVFIFAEQGAPSTLFVAVNVYNVTTLNQVSSASNCVTLPSGGLAIARDLSSAQLSPTTVQLFDYVNNVSFEVTASASWVGTGAESHNISTQIQNSPGFHLSSHFFDTSRGASATGSVTGAGTSLVSTPSDFGELDNVSDRMTTTN